MKAFLYKYRLEITGTGFVILLILYAKGVSKYDLNVSNIEYLLFIPILLFIWHDWIFKKLGWRRFLKDEI